MRAVVYHGAHDVRVENVPDPQIVDERDTIIQVTAPAICGKELYSLCENSNPNHEMMEKVYGYSGAGIYGYSNLYGGYAGGQAEYVRVPYADIGPIKVGDGLTDEQVLFLTDIFPTGYQAAEYGNIQG